MSQAQEADPHTAAMAEPANQSTGQDAAAGQGVQAHPSPATLLTGEEGGENSATAAPAATVAPGAPGAPAEAFQFTPIEGAAYTPEILATYAEQAKAMGLTQEQAQKVLELDAQNQIRAQETWAQEQAVQAEAWAKAVREDKDIGGANFELSVASARLALQRVDPDGVVKQMLDETGYGNHPEVVKLFKRVHDAMGEDAFISGAAKPQAELPLWDRMYKKS